MEEVDEFLVPALQFSDLVVPVLALLGLLSLEDGGPPFITDGVGINLMLQLLDMFEQHLLVIFLFLEQLLQVEDLLLDDFELLAQLILLLFLLLQPSLVILLHILVHLLLYCLWSGFLPLLDLEVPVVYLVVMLLQVCEFLILALRLNGELGSPFLGLPLDTVDLLYLPRDGQSVLLVL